MTAELPAVPPREHIRIPVRATTHPFRKATFDDPRPPTYEMELELLLSTGFTDPEELLERVPTVLKPGVSDIVFKFAEADYFCRLLVKYPGHEPAWMFHLDAFLGALRATWEMIKRASEKHPDLLNEIRRDIESNPNISAFIVGRESLRNKSMHETLDVPRVKSVRTQKFYQDGRQEVSLRHQRLELGGKSFDDATDACVDATNALWVVVHFCVLHGLGRKIRAGPTSLMETRFELEQKDGSWVEPLSGLRRGHPPRDDESQSSESR